MQAVVEALEDATEANSVCLSEIVGEFGTASFPPILLAVSVLLISPLSGVPLFSSIVGMTIFLIAVQGMIGRDRIWLPQRLANWRIDTRRSDRFLTRIRKVATWLDRGTTFRWTALVSPPASRVIYGICALCGLCLPLLEVVPLSSSLVGVTVALMSIGLLARDGLVAVLGLIALGCAATIPILAYTAMLG
ncbi:exopolysaccharide biosynthesis protein [uncultured Tateyamaria sp.]|uniref:exopolysaccharide biosynthesis protein n=1 Tax=uncultured Tateyamaria sp. TaxID=455651 RepID=UPI0026220465|nr:exopolysaccharide biosynthesis protein [uncultured Tateyamaria sp.]